jgi:tetratricopeptide (TPR) repeat protein
MFTVLACGVFGVLVARLERAAAAHDPARPGASGAQRLHADPMLNQALLAWRGGDPDKAAEVLRRAVREKPDGFDYWAYLARLQLQRGEDGPHILRFGNQVSARPLESDFDVEKWRGEKLAEALECFRKLVELRPDYVLGYGYQVLCLLGLGRLDEAEATARQAVAREPADAQWQLQLAAVLRMNDKLDDAAGVLDQVAKLAPRSGSLHQELFRLGRSRHEPPDELEQLRLRAVFFTYLIPTAVCDFSPERARVVERFGGGRSGLRAPDDVEAEELLGIIAGQRLQPGDFAADLWLSVLHHDNHEAAVTDAAEQAVAAAGPEVNDRLFWLLMNSPESGSAQRRAAKMLAERKDERILEPLTRFLPYDVELSAVEAATALAVLRDARAVPALCAACREESAPPADGPRPGQSEMGHQMNRRRCVQALRYFDTPQSLQTLEQVMGDPQVRSVALASLYFLRHDAKLLETLANMLSGPQADFHAVHDLALLEDDEAWQIVLERGPRSDNEQVRAHTARAIRYGDPTDAQRPAFLATLEQLARDPSKIVAQEAQRGLNKLNGGASGGG